MKHFIILFGLLTCFITTTVAASDDEFDMGDDTEISVDGDGGTLDCNVVQYEINEGADLAAVQHFDIAGIMLGMNFEDVQMAVRESGLYTLVPRGAVVYSIHQDWKYNLDYECRQNKVYAPAELEKCINSLARKRGVLYASEMHLMRQTTGETIDVYFTSNATDNVVWKITYKNDADEIEGDDPKFSNQRDKKIMAFWQNVLEKYGSPNADTDKWVSSDNSYDPMMTAYFGELELMECGIKSEDSVRNTKQANDNFIAKPYAF